MGCVNSRADINDLHPNIFQVTNVDDLGNLITPGRLKITESDIVLYQRGKPPVEWPLRCLRRYGYDSEIFSFESGRRCSTGPGIYAFKCRRADRLFNLVQVNIQVCNNSGGVVDDIITRDLATPGHPASTITRMTMPPVEANYLDPMPARMNSRATSRFSHSQQNGVGRLGSEGSSGGGPLSPPGTMGSSSPVTIVPTVASIPQSSDFHPSAVYVNDRVLSAIAMEIEMDNNNKNPGRGMQRSYTVSSNASSCGFMQESTTTTAIVGPGTSKPRGKPPPLTSATYINVDLNSEQSPLSPISGVSLRDEDTRETEMTRRAYMNVSPGVDARPEAAPSRTRPTALSDAHSSQQQQQQYQYNHHHHHHHQHHPLPLPSLSSPSPPPSSTPPSSAIGVGDLQDFGRHCYANLEKAEMEQLRIRYEKSPPIQAPTLSQSLSVPLSSLTSGQRASSPPPLTEPIREVNYAVLDLDKTSVSAVSSTVTGSSEHAVNATPSPPDSPNKPQKGYATIDFNKTAALSHSVNPNLVNDNEGSRKTRHNSTINDVTTPSRHSSSMSE